MAISARRKTARRWTMVAHAINSLTSSFLAGFLLVALVCVLVGTACQAYWFLGLVWIPFLAVFRRRLLFEALVVENTIEHLLGTFTWISKTEERGLYLGALPVFLNHEYHLTKKLNIGAILSVCEPWELTTPTLAGTPVSPSQWKAAGISHLILSARDFEPPGLRLLDDGADFINKRLSEMGNVYVHCKSGRGRSAIVVCAYLVKYKRLDAHNAHAELLQSRQSIFSRDSSLMRQLVSYETWLHTASIKKS